MPMTKLEAVKTGLLEAMLHGSEETRLEAAKIMSSLAKAKRLGTLDAELADLARQMPAVSQEAGKDEARRSSGRSREVAVKRRKAGKLGIVRLDYDYPPAPGDIDCPASFPYEVVYRVVPGLTFERVQNNDIPEEVARNFEEAIRWLEKQGVAGITGDCGFMMYLQERARRLTSLPVFMSALVQVPVINCTYSLNEAEQIAVFTANSKTLLPMRDLIRKECGLDVSDPGRFIIVGCQDVPGFEAVALGAKVDTEKVQPGMMKLAKKVLADNPKVKCIVLECTELPPYADALRWCTGLPVYDAITACNGFMTGVQDNERFGLAAWQFTWDGEQRDYHFGDNLSKEEIASLVNKPSEAKGLMKKIEEAGHEVAKWEKAVLQDTLKKIGAGKRRRKAGKLGVVRLDYDYPPAPGDIDSPQSFPYEVVYRVVPGLTFELVQSGKVPDAVKTRFREAVKYLEEQGASAITGDCGFMMYLQTEARRATSLPIFMSALAQLGSIDCAYSEQNGEQIAVFTANGKSLTPMRQQIKELGRLDVADPSSRFVIVGCQDVPGFEAVAEGKKVDVAAVTPGMVDLCLKTIKKHPKIRAILLECTEMPPYADALRAATGLPVYDAITACDFFMMGVQDNERFGLQDWQKDWDGTQEHYTFAAHLSKEDRELLVN